MTVYVAASAPTPGQQIGVSLALDATWSASTDSPLGTMNGMQLIVFDTNKSGAQAYNSGYLAASGTSASKTVTIPANTLTAGKTYVFQFYAADNTGQSAIVDVTVSAVVTTVTPTITVPAAAAVIGSPVSTVTWTLANGNTNYQIQVLNGATVVWDSGEVASTAQTNSAVPFPDTGVARTVRVRAKRSAAYAWSAWATVNVTVSHLPPMTPVVASLTATDVAALGVTHALVAAITQPTPSGGAPAVASTEVYVRAVGDASNGALVGTSATSLTAFTFTSPASGVSYQMRVRSVSSDGRYAYSAWTTANAPIALRGVALYSVAAPTAVKLFLYNGDEAEDDYQPEAELIQYDGRAFPVVEFGTSSSRELQVKIAVKTPADRDTLRGLLLSRTVLLYRDRRGRKVYAFVKAGPFVDTIYGTSTELTIIAVDYPPDRSA